MAPTLVAVLALACLIAAVQIQVRIIEEPYLRRLHGHAYTRYAAQAGRFLPGLGRTRSVTGKARTNTGAPDQCRAASDC